MRPDLRTCVQRYWTSLTLPRSCACTNVPVFGAFLHTRPGLRTHAEVSALSDSAAHMCMCNISGSQSLGIYPLVNLHIRPGLCTPLYEEEVFRTPLTPLRSCACTNVPVLGAWGSPLVHLHMHASLRTGAEGSALSDSTALMRMHKCAGSWSLGEPCSKSAHVPRFVHTCIENGGLGSP